MSAGMKFTATQLERPQIMQIGTSQGMAVTIDFETGKVQVLEAQSCSRVDLKLITKHKVEITFAGKTMAVNLANGEFSVSDVMNDVEITTPRIGLIVVTIKVISDLVVHSFGRHALRNAYGVGQLVKGDPFPERD